MEQDYLVCRRKKGETEQCNRKWVRGGRSALLYAENAIRDGYEPEVFVSDVKLRRVSLDDLRAHFSRRR